MKYRNQKAFAVILLLVVFDVLIFKFAFNASYFEWYLQQGVSIGLVSALFTIAWGELDRQPGLISAYPAKYLAACGFLILLPGYMLSVGLKSGTRGLNEPEVNPRQSCFEMIIDMFDAIVGLPLIFLLIGLLVTWFVTIAPFQYFVFLICGAPARIFSRSQLRVTAKFEDTQFKVEVVNKKGRVIAPGNIQVGKAKSITEQGEINDGWWEATANKKPFSMTVLFSSIFFLALQYFL
jgi:hypothetical protein